MAAILLISPEHWSAHAVSKHHYASLLASRGHQVCFLEPPEADAPESEIQFLASNPGLQLIRSKRVAPGLRFLPALVRRRLESRWLWRFEKRIGQRIDVIWLFENSRFYDLRFAGSRLKIYHQVDLNQTFHPATAARTADICFCTTDLIQQALVSHSAHVHVIHHGLQQPTTPMPLSPAQRQHFQRPGPHLLYSGNLAMGYMDVELLAAVAREHSDATVHLVGGAPADAPLRKALAHQANVVWWGHQPSAALPGILEHADILLVTYQQSHWRDQASPHKMMEYLASGRVVVATYTDQYRDYRHLLAMADLDGDFLALLRQVRESLPLCNSPDRVQQRRAFALDHTYARQLERIESLLLSQGLPRLAAAR